MQKLYEKCVPAEERERIEKIIVQKEVRRKSEEAASRRFVFIEAKKNGVTSCRIGEGYGTPLEVALTCRRLSQRRRPWRWRWSSTASARI